jgi:hypothetical protein
MTAASREEPASKEELIDLIARELNWPKATTRLHLERIRDDFAGIFGDPVTGILGGLQRPSQHRDSFREIERTFREAGKAALQAPQEIEWLPSKLSVEPRKFEWAKLDSDGWQFQGFEYAAPEFKGWQFEGRIRDGLELMLFCTAVSEAAKQAADRLEKAGLHPPSTTPAEKAIARYALVLLNGPFFAEKKFQQHRTIAQYVWAKWPQLSRKFRGKHSTFQKLRRKRWRQLVALGFDPKKKMQDRPLNPVLPRPTVEQYEPPKGIRTRFPRGQYHQLTALVFGYVTGEHREPDSFETACREARNELGL